MHTLQPFKIVPSSSRCTDYVEVRHPGFGVTESCGTEPGDNRLQLGEGGRKPEMKYAAYSYSLGHHVIKTLSHGIN